MRYAAFLRGVNLGKRQVRSAELKPVFEQMGFGGVKTLLASGNVLFDADAPDPREIETTLKERFGFEIGTVLRTRDELAALVASDPFNGRTEDENTKLYVTFFGAPVGQDIPATKVEGDFEVVKTTPRVVFVLAFRTPEGRFGPGQDQIVKGLPKSVLWTARNWNTVVKAAVA